MTCGTTVLANGDRQRALAFVIAMLEDPDRLADVYRASPIRELAERIGVSSTTIRLLGAARRH